MQKNSRKEIIYPTLLAVAVVAGIFIGMLTARRSADPMMQVGASSKAYADNKLVYALSLIDRMYVDPVDLDSLSADALMALLEELDPHSTYIPAEDFGSANEALDGEFDGIGVVFNMGTDTVIVLNVISSGPSDKAGIRNGDRIMRINDSLVAGQKIPQNNIVKMLRGKRGTTVDLAIQRQGIKDLVPITVTRGIIPIKSLDAAFMITPDVGFIKLSAFSKNSLLEIHTALSMLKMQGMKKLIFDLRDNSGGFLDQATAIANMFLPADKMIVYTEDRYKRKVEEFSNGKGGYTDIPLTILVNEGSASSSEILAGAIQDNDRGMIIGRRTFGKGLVQQQIPFSDGSAIRLTIARYYTPTGRSIQKPYSEGSKQYHEELYTRYEHNEFFSADSISFADSLRFTTPGGRTVYGGGGIMPDIFVPLDTVGFSRYFMEVSGRNILYRYTIEYSDRHRDALNAVNDVRQLDSLFDADKGLLDGFVAYASRNGVKPDYAGINRSKDIIMAQLRAYIGRNTPLEDNGFYSNIYPVDNTILTAIGELEKEGE